jgi:hypothetical protein
MKRRFRRDSTGWVEHELRRSRPEPRDDFVRELSGLIEAEVRRRPARGLRAAFVGSLASLMVVSLAAVGGMGYAASAAKSVARSAESVVAPKATLTPRQTAAAAQYVGKVTICHHTHSATNPFVTITISRAALPAHLRHGDTVGPCTTSGVLGAQNTRGSGGTLGTTATSSSLPFTGLGLLSVVLVGAVALGTGVALRRSNRT